MSNLRCPIDRHRKVQDNDGGVGFTSLKVNGACERDRYGWKRLFCCVEKDMDVSSAKLQKMKGVLESLKWEVEEKEEEEKRLQEGGKEEESRLRTKEEMVVKATKEMESEKERWEKEKKELEAEIATLKSATVEESALCDMRGKRDEMKKAREEMAEELRCIQERNEQLEQSVSKLQEKMRDLSEKDSSLQSDLQRLLSRSTALQQSLEQSESSSARDLEKLEKQIGDRRKEKEILQVEIRRVCSLLGCAETMSGVGEAVKGLQEKKSVLEEEETRLRSQLSTSEDKRTEQVQQQRLLERELKELMEENTRPVDVTSVAEIRSVETDGRCNCRWRLGFRRGRRRERLRKRGCATNLRGKRASRSTFRERPSLQRRVGARRIKDLETTFTPLRKQRVRVLFTRSL